MKNNIDHKRSQPANAISPRIVKVAELLGDENYVIGLVLDSDKRYILTPAQETHGTIDCYDEPYNFSLIQYSPTTFTLPLDAPPLSGVHPQEGSDVQVVTKNGSDEVSILAGTLRFIEGRETGIAAVTYSADGAGAAPGSLVLSDGKAISIVTGPKSQGTDFILSLAIPLAVCRTRKDKGQGRGRVYSNMRAEGGGSQHNGDLFLFNG